MNFILSSSVFKNNERIPDKHTCRGSDISPALEWKDVPVNTKSFVLIMDDPDAPNGTWDHWLVYNIQSNTTNISEGQLPEQAKYAKNSWGNKNYGGPCPPPGKDHRYFFTVYALDILLAEIPSDSTKKDLLQIMENHILDKATLIGLYSR